MKKVDGNVNAFQTKGKWCQWIRTIEIVHTKIGWGGAFREHDRLEAISAICEGGFWVEFVGCAACVWRCLEASCVEFTQQSNETIMDEKRTFCGCECIWLEHGFSLKRGFMWFGGNGLNNNQNERALNLIHAKLPQKPVCGLLYFLNNFRSDFAQLFYPMPSDKIFCIHAYLNNENVEKQLFADHSIEPSDGDCKYSFAGQTMFLLK